MSRITKLLSLMPFAGVLCFCLLLSVYSKQFAYLSFSVHGFPIFISELMLFLVLLGRINHWRRIFALPAPLLISLSSYLLWGLARLVVSFCWPIEGGAGTVDALKQTTIFYLEAWFFVPFLFSVKQNARIFSASLLGAGIAQLLGWIGFILMGSYGQAYSRLLGFPVGNEVLLPLYPLAFMLWSSASAEAFSATFGLMWLTQFILYMKRTWVFSVVVLSLPVALARMHGKPRERLMPIFRAFMAGILIASFTLIFVHLRDSPPFLHIEASGAKVQRQQFSNVTNGLLFLVDKVFPYTDPLETQVSFSRVVFKGDLLVQSNASTSFMAFRMHLWRQAWAGFREHPLIGKGFGPHIVQTQLNGLPAVVDGRWISGPHNGFLTILNRMGLIGAALFLYVVLAALTYAVRVQKRTNLWWALVSAVISVNFFVLFNVCLENPQGGIWYWLFLGILVRVSCATPEQLE